MERILLAINAEGSLSSLRIDGSDWDALNGDAFSRTILPIVGPSITHLTLDNIEKISTNIFLSLPKLASLSLFGAFFDLTPNSDHPTAISPHSLPTIRSFSYERISRTVPDYFGDLCECITHILPLHDVASAFLRAETEDDLNTMTDLFRKAHNALKAVTIDLSGLSNKGKLPE
ncbi:hypothetical protein CC1G_12981 [Coprinopsis cinerea okayama7|uniref:Uncharacterized protein n=1 Tax=Coprinopsis cinerea (strain Okayama-7 / 130 / ATCC MYA-4618 / FGSC 9003) TaxID=240176 RepID=A8PHK8_COPC7|nr:hypothetical protein CC1G_12981 [Coprinopsis cinerea okayama7\|eukprot:XP_001841424.2 hypothetical protein CC1G_12981 [Coprinopsis cinerea okayama7\